jgi:prepilin-type N-terminal cleavage/methylation domain-containing protein
MKISNSHHPVRGLRIEARGGISPCPGPDASSPASGFTMIEIAVCLAIIGFALVAIIGVLPLGMNTQRDVREQTIINQDATVLLNDIRTAARGADDLTNNVYAIDNTQTYYDNKGAVMSGSPHYAVYTFTNATYDGTSLGSQYWLTNGANIIGLLSTPVFTANSYPYQALSSTFNTFFISNHIVAYVRSISGLAAEKPPQNNPIMVNNTLTYRVYCVNAPVAVDTNTFISSFLARQLAASQRELRLTFLWPQLPNGNIGNHVGSPQTFRVSVAGQLTPTNDNGNLLYFYQPQSFTNAP